jgi:hypothetical protein
VALNRLMMAPHLAPKERSQRQLEWNRQTRMDTNTATDAGPCPVPRAGVRRGSSYVALPGARYIAPAESPAEADWEQVRSLWSPPADE